MNGIQVGLGPRLTTEAEVPARTLALKGRTPHALGVLALVVAAGGCATSSGNSPQLTAVFERLEAATVRTEMAAEQAAAAAQQANEARAQSEPPLPSGPYHSALSVREQRNTTPQPVRNQRDAARIATQFLKAQHVDWGKPPAVTRSELGYYIVEFPYRQTDRWDLDGVLLVHYESGDVYLPLPR